MGQADHILAIDQGTTSTRAILFDAEARPVATAQRELPQHYPRPGWVEHDPEDIWGDTLAVAREALAGIDIGRVASIGIANQRETAVVWGPSKRRADPPRNRLAGPPHGRTLRPTQGGRCRGLDQRAHRAPARPLFLSDEDCMDP